MPHTTTHMYCHTAEVWCYANHEAQCTDRQVDMQHQFYEAGYAYASLLSVSRICIIQDSQLFCI